MPKQISITDLVNKGYWSQLATKLTRPDLIDIAELRPTENDRWFKSGRVRPKQSIGQMDDNPSEF